MKYQITVNVDHESGEGAVSMAHNGATFFFDLDGTLHVFENNYAVGTYVPHVTNWVMIQPVHLP